MIVVVRATRRSGVSSAPSSLVLLGEVDARCGALRTEPDQ
jgi:hypothetical protein